MDKRFLGILLAIALVLGGVFFLTNSDKADAPSAASGTLTNHVQGQGTSGVTLTEYGDFQCPACGQYYPILKQVKAQYGDQIKFQFRNFPLFEIHPNAIAASRAAEAADMQGKFWEMHDQLYENQTSWGAATNPQSPFEGYAKTIGLDTAKFTTDFKSRMANDRIQADLKEGNRLGVNSTPTFFVDGKKISSPQSLDAFNKVIAAAIKQKTGKDPVAPATAPAASTAEPAPATGDAAAPAETP